MIEDVFVVAGGGGRGVRFRVVRVFKLGRSIRLSGCFTLRWKQL